jgi:hypothetical protein
MKRVFAFAILAVAGSAQATLLDDFNSGPGSDSITSGTRFSTQSGTMVGGDRMDALAVDSNPNGVSFGYIVANGLVSGSAGARLAGRYESDYGYSNVTPTSFSFDDMNLNLSADSRFVVDFNSNDQPANLAILIQTNGGGFRSVNHAIAGGRATTPFTETILFSEFTGVNFADIDQLVLHLDVSASGDVAIDQFSSVPEPATMACLALGAAGLITRRRRR